MRRFMNGWMIVACLALAFAAGCAQAAGPAPGGVGAVDDGGGVPGKAFAPAAAGGDKAAVITHGSFGGAPYALDDAAAVAAFKAEAAAIGAGGYASDTDYMTMEEALISFDGHSTYVTDRGGCIYTLTVVKGLLAGDIVEIDNNSLYNGSSFWDQAPYWVLIGPYTHNTTQTILNWLIYVEDAGDGTYTMVIGSGEYNLALNNDDLTTVIGDWFGLTREVKVWTGATLVNPLVSGRGYTYSSTGITGGTLDASDSLATPDLAIVAADPVFVDDDWTGFSNGDDAAGHVYGQDAFATITQGIAGVLDAGTVNVAAGTYVEAVAVTRPMTLRGATALVNKNGYAVPAGYAWDDAVESIIMHPNPTVTYNAVVDIYDTGDVTFEGFVVQELAAVGNLNVSLVRVYAYSAPIDNIVVRNNVIGPNTNTTYQDGTHGRMGLYIVNHPYTDFGVRNSTFAGNKIFDAKGNGNNVFIWSSYYAYGAPQPASMAGTVIEGNEIYGSHRSGIETAGGFTDLVIRGNTIYGQSGLPSDNPNLLKYGHGMLLIRGSSDKTGGPTTAYGPVRLLVEGNEIYGNEKSGIYMEPRVTDITLTGNVIHDNGWDGVMLDLEGNYWNPQYESPPTSLLYACYDCASGLQASGNEIYDNGTDGNPLAVHGVQVVGAPTNGMQFDAVGNWWGDATGPYHPTLNAGGLGNDVSDYVLFDPWLGMADLAFDPATSGPINCAQTVTLDFVYTPDPETPDLRGYNVVVTTGGSGITFGAADFANAHPFGANPDQFFVLPGAPGEFTVSGAQLGGTTGLDHQAVLFRLTVHATFPDGTGEVNLTGWTLRDLDNGPIVVDTATGAVVTVDCIPPAAVTNISALPEHQEVRVNWTNSSSGDVVAYEIWRGLWYDTTPGVSAYPEYDDLAGDVIPTRPASRAAADASPEWDLAGTFVVGVGTKPFVDAIAPRGVYYYEVFALDAAGNYSAPASLNDRSTNYWLGDVEPYVDGYVNTADVSELGATFGTSHGDPLYDNWVDVGPTDDNGRLGIPLTDSAIDFEDLMIFAMNFGFALPKGGAVAPVSAVALTLAQVDATTWSLGLAQPCPFLKGVRVTAAAPPGASTVAEGDLLRAQAAPVFLRNLDRNGLDANLALFGTDAGFAGAGELLRFTLPEGTDPAAVRVTARGLGNETIVVALQGGDAPSPAVWALAQNAPNPFNPQTTIAFSIASAQRVRLAVYAVDGTLVRGLVDADLSAGRHEAVWDGRDQDGRAVASGAYFCRIEAGPWSQTRKMTLMK